MTDENDFAAMLEASFSAPRRRLAIGDRVRATITQVCPDRLIVDLGDGRDGLMERNQLGDPDELPLFEEGMTLDAFILSFEDRVPLLGLKMGRAAAGREGLERAHHSGLPIEGLVAEVNKGGYVVEAGGLRCFCPLGAMDIRFIEDPSIFIGRKLLFRVTELKGSRDVVLSRRAILEEENARLAIETRAKLVPGARLRGTVTNIRDFGAFVDLGGIEGLVPARELGYGWTRAHDAVTLGQDVDVEVLSVEPGKDGRERIALSMRALMEDPFAKAAEELSPGMMLAGTVTRLQPFGAFVEIVAGVEGLIHVSAFGRRIGHPSEMVNPGQAVAVRVDGVDAGARRISLHLADAAELAGSGPGTMPTSASGLRILRLAPPPPPPPDPSAEPAVSAEPAAPQAQKAPAGPAPKIGDVFEVTVDTVAKFGVFVSWPTGRGLVPGRELGVPQGTDLRRQFPPGATFRAVILDIREDGKVALSLTAVERAEERAMAEAWVQATPAPGRGLGNLGDLLRAKRHED